MLRIRADRRDDDASRLRQLGKRRVVVAVRNEHRPTCGPSRKLVANGFEPLPRAPSQRYARAGGCSQRELLCRQPANKPGGAEENEVIRARSIRGIRGHRKTVS